MDELGKNIRRIIQTEQANVEQSSALLQELMSQGVQNLNELDHVADRLLDTMSGITGAGEDVYRQYLDYIETFDPIEAKERKDNLEYDMGYKTHVLYAAAMLCQQELNGYSSADGKPSFDVVMQQYIPKVFDVKKKTASFLFFAHLGNRRSVDDLMRMLQTITEETEYILAHVDEFEDLMNFPRENYHPLRDDEWQLIKYIVEHNLEIINTNEVQCKELMHNVFGTFFD
jgi:hypothetical protein